ncbi:SWIM zinc finger family protein [Nocardioides humi]|uniref:SWIM-type domain-containing protein n=1 Tax=Nocardioides humi TaxID=449461 RepID=A0ABN1ZXS2_9ACTN|nr:SWIM zinc finger family protein [Nocardioides humi]
MAAVLSEERLLDIAGPTVFGRGEDYVGYVRGLRVVGARATATIQARNVYLVDLSWADGSPDGSCTCPHYAEGNFCKHLVAVGLAVVADLSSEELRTVVRDALATRGLVDYGRSFEVARDAEEMLDELEGYLDRGAADAVRPVLLKATERLPGHGDRGQRRRARPGDEREGQGQAPQEAAQVGAVRST